MSKSTDVLGSQSSHYRKKGDTYMKWGKQATSCSTELELKGTVWTYTQRHTHRDTHTEMDGHTHTSATLKGLVATIPWQWWTHPAPKFWFLETTSRSKEPVLCGNMPGARKIQDEPRNKECSEWMRTCQRDAWKVSTAQINHTLSIKMHNDNKL